MGQFDDDEEGFTGWVKDQLPLDQVTIGEFPAHEGQALTCVHGNRVWFGHECGECEAAGVYRWVRGARA